MTVDLDAATAFMATHARLLDRHRLIHLLGGGDSQSMGDALAAYRNADGGYGWGLEPDLRAPESQPGGALHAFEVFDELGPLPTPAAVALCDWLRSVTLADGGLPFALPIADPAGCASFWAEADSSVSSLHITAAVTAYALRAARHNDGIARHPWLAQATDYCLRAIAQVDGPLHAIELKFVLEFLDVLSDERPEVVPDIERLGRSIPPNGLLHVGGGLEDEMMRPLDFAPLPDRPVRALFDDAVVSSELDEVAEQQDRDGGWHTDFAAASPAAALEWRGYRTVWAISILRRNRRLRL